MVGREGHVEALHLALWQSCLPGEAGRTLWYLAGQTPIPFRACHLPSIPPAAGCSMTTLHSEARDSRQTAGL